MNQEDLVRAGYLRAVAVDYAKHFIGTPYHWGGDDPMAGFDCSGLVVEVLQAVGRLAHGRDYTANDLLSIFRPGQVALGYAGCLAFYLNLAGRAVHVVILIDNTFAIGADGGGSSTITLEDAIAQDAFIKIRPVDYRRGPWIIVDPFKGVPV
jgi:hypothetical protein